MQDGMTSQWSTSLVGKYIAAAIIARDIEVVSFIKLFADAESIFVSCAGRDV